MLLKRMLLKHPHFVGSMLALVLLATVVGCGEPEQEVDMERDLSFLGIWYSQFAADNGGFGPASEEDLREYMSSQDAELNIDELMTLDRDGETVVIVPGQRPTMPGMEESPTPLAFERKGDGEKRYVVFGGPVVQQLENSELEKMLPSGTSLP
jgi:hypothetical protein